MPGPKNVRSSDLFCSISEKSQSFGERYDCSVKAVCVITGIDYGTVHRQFSELGRVGRKSTPSDITAAVMKSFGWKTTIMRYLERKAIIEKYPAPHFGLQNITTYHPERFHQVWAEFDNLLIFTRGHISAFKGGKLHDWAVGRTLRVHTIWKCELV